jgi:hypothetical protein
LCCSKEALVSWWVDKEVEKALMKEERLSKERGQETLAIIPLNLDGHIFKPDWTDWKQQHLISRMAPDFTGWDKDNAKFEQQLERVIQALRADARARELPPSPGLERSGVSAERRQSIERGQRMRRSADAPLRRQGNPWRGVVVKKPGFFGLRQQYILDKRPPDTRFDQCLQGFRVLKKAFMMTCTNSATYSKILP